MIVHTLIFAFGEGRTQAEQDKFLATELSGADALVSFERSEQQRSPYGVVWANTEPFTTVADALKTRP